MIVNGVPIRRDIDWVDAYIEGELAKLNPGQGREDLPEFTARDVEAFANLNGADFQFGRGGSLLQDHKRAQTFENAFLRPRHSIYSVRRGRYGAWKVGHPAAVPYINQTAIDWAAQMAVNRITECADPAALGDPRMQKAVELAKKQVTTQLELLAEMLGLIEAA